MNTNDIKRKMYTLKQDLLYLYKCNRSVSKKDINRLLELDADIHRIYNEYLKLFVQIDNRIPIFTEDWQYPHSSCYYYALNLPIPIEFEKLYKSLTGYDFESHLGSIANLPYQDNFTKEEVLETLYSDLDALKIKWYESSIDEEPHHDGYKIALLVDETLGDTDFHFIRQNRCGRWSEKDGCGTEVVSITTPEKFTTDPFYKYVKTLELVKPTIGRR